MDMYADGSGALSTDANAGSVTPDNTAPAPQPDTAPPQNTLQSWLSFAQRPYEQGGLGLAKHQAAGLVGNLVNESGSALTPWGPTGDNGSAWGTAQWRGDRLAALKAAFPDTYKTTDAQQQFMRQEFAGPESKAFAALQAAQTPEDAATAVNHLYERSADTTNHRALAARAIFEGNNPVAAINAAAGTGPAPSGAGALAFANKASDGGDDDEDGSLSTGKTLGPGALKQIMQDEPEDKKTRIAAGLSQIAASLAGVSNPAQAAQLTAQAAAIKKDGQSTYKYMMGADGTLYRMDDTGGISAIQTGSAKNKQVQLMKLRGEDGADHVVAYDLKTGQPLGGAQAQAPSAPIGGDPNLTGQDRYKSMTPDERQLVDMWHGGTGPNPTLSRNNPRIEKLMEAARSVYPDLDFAKYGERQAFFKGMASKSPTTAGGQFISAPTVLDHLSNLADSYLHQGNSGGGGFTYAAEAANAMKDWSGGTPRQSLLTDTDRNADTAGKEITSFLTRGHGGISEREDAHNKLYLPREAPEVQASALEAYRKQVSDRFYELLDGAKGSVGEDNPEVAKAAAAFKAKDEAIQEKIAKLKKGQFGTSAPAAPAAPGNRPPLASFF